MQRSSSIFFKFFALASFLIASLATAAPTGFDGFAKKRQRPQIEAGLSDKALQRHEKASQRDAKRSQKSEFQAIKQKKANRRQDQASRMAQTSFARENLLACASSMIRSSAHKGMKARGGNNQRKASMQGKAQSRAGHKAQGKAQSRAGHKAQGKAQSRAGHKAQGKAQSRAGHKAQGKKAERAHQGRRAR